jgi:hypothetical protein
MNRPRLGRSGAVTPAVADTAAQLVVASGESPPVIVQVALTAQDMDAALAIGDAVHLSPLITDFIYHQKHWWIAYADGWLRVDDHELIELLTTQHHRFSGPPGPTADRR